MLGLVQNTGVCSSFSAIGNHLLMWSHYANHHRGFCVEYDSREGTKLRTLARLVRYQDEVPSLAASDFTPEKRGDALDTMWLTKATCRAYEQEWRVMMNEGNKPFQAPSEVVSVVFGARMPEPKRILIAHALRHRPAIAFKEARLVEGKFLLEIVEI